MEAGMMSLTLCMLWLCSIGHGEEHVLDRGCALVALYRT